MADIHGTCDERFEAVRGALAKNLDSGEELGASIVVDIDGDNVVDMWGGFRDEARAIPWDEHTITNVWSSTKTVTSLAALMLVDRGELDVDQPVAKYWPEFAANGKQDVAGPARHVARLRGVRAGPARSPSRTSTTGSRPTSRMAAQAPWWEPGTASGYHALNYGHLVGEVVRRISGKTLKQFVAEEIAGPLGADFQIGAAESDWGRIAPVVPPPPLPIDLEALGLDSPAVKTFTGPVVERRLRQHAGLAARRHRRRQRARECPVRGAGHVGGGPRRRGRRGPPARPGNHRPDLPRAAQRHRPGAGRPAALRHRLRAAAGRRRAVHPGREDLLLGRLGRLDHPHGPRPPDDGLLHDEQDGTRRRRLRPERRLRRGGLRRGVPSKRDGGRRGRHLSGPRRAN